MNSLEALAMGIPCMTSMTPDFEAFRRPHPFFVITEDSLEEQIVELARDPSVLAERSRAGRKWVEDTHGADRIVEFIYEKYRELGWLPAAERARG
jgi:hypothetical protein